jgi:riboflavin biosynthesis pyrimidine reductase
VTDATDAAVPKFSSLFPERGPADIATVYAPMPGRYPDRAVRVNMIASVDGGTALGGTSGSLGGAADRHLFLTLRSFADLILVGAGTVRAERYGPARLDAKVRDERVARGQSPVPPIAVVTRAADLDWASPFFADAEVTPLIVTAATSRGRVPDNAAADIVVAGEDRVDIGTALDEIAGRGYRNVLLEGGPTINGDLLDRDAIDELCVTLAPTLVGGSSSRIIRGADTSPVLRLQLASVLTADGYLFLRYRREGPAA